MSIDTNKTSRRAMLAGLAIAPVAGLPAIATAAAPACPALAAVAEYQRLKAIEAAAFDQCSRIDAEIKVKRLALGVVDGEGNPLGDDYFRIFGESGIDKAEIAAGEAQDHANSALIALFQTSPTSSRGALAMLRVAIDEIDDACVEAHLIDGNSLINAVRRAICILEGVRK